MFLAAIALTSAWLGLSDRHPVEFAQAVSLPKFEQTYSLDDGNGRIHIKLEWRDEGIGDHKIAICSKNCRGKKHLLHEQCDDSCDRTCVDNHAFTLKPSLYHKSVLESEMTLKKNFQKFGTAYDGSEVAAEVYQTINNAAQANAKRLTTEIKWQHWFTGNCGEQVRLLKARFHTAIVKYELYREVQDASGKLIHGAQIKGELPVMGYAIFTGDYEQLNPKTYCRCTIVSQAPERTGEVPKDEDTTTGVCMTEENGKVVPVPTELLEQCGFSTVCEDMNSCTVTAQNTTDKPIEFTIFPGSFLECQTPGYQNMLITSQCKLTLPPGQVSASLSWLGATDAPVTKRAQVLCLNMNLKEPNASVQYSIGSAPSLMTRQLAMLSRKRKAQGPWDQARAWILTDAAPLSEIRKRLLPTPSRGAYINCLYEVAKDAQADLGGNRYNACFDPDLLSGIAATREASFWFVNEMASRRPIETADWLSSHAVEFADALNKGIPADWTRGASLLNSLCTCADRGVRIAALQMLLHDSFRPVQAKLAQAGGYSGALSAVLGTDSVAAGKALEIAEMVRPTFAPLFLRNINPRLPAEIRAKAATLLRSF